MQIFEDLFLLQRIDHLIRTRATGKPEQLASRLGVSERKIYRLIGSLRDQGFPISYNKREDTYYYDDEVRLEFSIVVGHEKLLLIRGGEAQHGNASFAISLNMPYQEESSTVQHTQSAGGYYVMRSEFPDLKWKLGYAISR